MSVQNSLLSDQIESVVFDGAEPALFGLAGFGLHNCFHGVHPFSIHYLRIAWRLNRCGPIEDSGLAVGGPRFWLGIAAEAHPPWRTEAISVLARCWAWR